MPLTQNASGNDKPLITPPTGTLSLRSGGGCGRQNEGGYMKAEIFNRHLAHMQKVTVNTLIAKAAEYASDDDRLHNFKVAAALQGETPEKALGGMMAKHTVSIFDMINDVESGKYHTIAIWEEKIKDHINYLFLLWALVNDTEATT
jgi:hypothetical protein